MGTRGGANVVIEMPALLTAFGATPGRATVVVARNSVGRRVARALAALGACWALALVAVFIPVAHFVLVPSLLVAGPVAAVVRLREDRTLVKLHGVCPRCGLEQDFRAGGRFRSPRTVYCTGCRTDLLLTADPAAGAP